MQHRPWVACAVMCGLALAVGSAVGAAPIDDGTTLAMPSVYRVQVKMHVDGFVLRRSGGAPQRVMVPPDERTFDRVGTAFAVAPEGVLATAAHLVAPTPTEVVSIVGPRLLAGQGVATNAAGMRAWGRRATPVGVRVVSITLWPAYASGRSPAEARAVRARVVPGSIRHGVALISAPSLSGVPGLGTVRNAPHVTMLGFGSARAGAPLEPWPRPADTAVGGIADGTKPVEGVYPVTSAAGDAGAPFVDGEGRVAAIALSLIDARECAQCTRAASVDALASSLKAGGVTAAPGPAGEALQRALDVAATGDERGALSAYAEAGRLFPGLSDRADITRVLFRRGDTAARDGRVRGLLWVLAALQIAGAAAVAWYALTRSHHPPPPAGRQGSGSARMRSR